MTFLPSQAAFPGLFFCNYSRICFLPLLIPLLLVSGHSIPRKFSTEILIAQKKKIHSLCLGIKKIITFSSFFVLKYCLSLFCLPLQFHLALFYISVNYYQCCLRLGPWINRLWAPYLKRSHKTTAVLCTLYEKTKTTITGLVSESVCASWSGTREVKSGQVLCSLGSIK